MKKSKKTALTAVIFAAALNATACTPPDIDVQTEYGAPIAEPTEQETSVLETKETYNPEEEIPLEVYGPPKFSDDTTEENVEEETEKSSPQPEESIPEYQPQVDRPLLVYGPPEAFGGE